MGVQTIGKQCVTVTKIAEFAILKNVLGGGYYIDT